MEAKPANRMLEIWMQDEKGDLINMIGMKHCTRLQGSEYLAIVWYRTN